MPLSQSDITILLLLCDFNNIIFYVKFSETYGAVANTWWFTASFFPRVKNKTKRKIICISTRNKECLFANIYSQRCARLRAISRSLLVHGTCIHMLLNFVRSVYYAACEIIHDKEGISSRRRVSQPLDPPIQREISARESGASPRVCVRVYENVHDTNEGRGASLNKINIYARVRNNRVKGKNGKNKIEDRRSSLTVSYILRVYKNKKWAREREREIFRRIFIRVLTFFLFIFINISVAVLTAII